MDTKTLDFLSQHGVIEPICQSCLSESFHHFMIFQNAVIFCDCCAANLRSENANTALISQLNKPKIKPELQLVKEHLR